MTDYFDAGSGPLIPSDVFGYSPYGGFSGSVTYNPGTGWSFNIGGGMGSGPGACPNCGAGLFAGGSNLPFLLVLIVVLVLLLR